MGTAFGDNELRFSHEFNDFDADIFAPFNVPFPNKNFDAQGCPYLQARAKFLRNKELLSVE